MKSEDVYACTHLPSLSPDRHTRIEATEVEGRSVVTGDDDDGLVAKTELVEQVHQTTDVTVESRDHRSVGGPGFGVGPTWGRGAGGAPPTRAPPRSAPPAVLYCREAATLVANDGGQRIAQVTAMPGF